MLTGGRAVVADFGIARALQVAGGERLTGTGLGPETFEALRQLPGLEKTPAVFMTANVMKEDMERYKAMGVLDVIAKPFEPTELPNRLNELWAGINV